MAVRNLQLFCPETNIDEAKSFAERLNKIVANTEILIDEQTPLKVTVSMGVAEYRKEWTKEEFIDRVDQLLYKAKKLVKIGLKLHYNYFTDIELFLDKDIII